MELIEILVYVFIVLGAFTRTAMPAIRKLKEAVETGGKFKWDHKYTLTFLIAIIVAVPSAFIALPNFQVPYAAGDGVVLGAAYTYGLGLTTIINEVKSWIFG